MTLTTSTVVICTRYSAFYFNYLPQTVNLLVIRVKPSQANEVLWGFYREL